ncbi:T9SS type A sorting domain-containing protein, partial [Crocinitomix catalasitica]|nr:T9SS type A sorting domain-containing protein [Crocinitomix catalasitica]
GGGILQIEELFNVRFSPPEKVVHQNQGGKHYLFDLHEPNQLVRIGEEYIDGSKIGTGQFNNSATYLRTTTGTITPGLTDEQAKLYTENFDMISFWDDYNLLVLESDVLKLFSTGTAVVGMQDAIEADVEIAPNPATDYINFTVNMISDEAELAVYTITGKTVYKTTVINGQNLIDTKDLSQGTYVLKLTANNRQIFTDKLIIK